MMREGWNVDDARGPQQSQQQHLPLVSGRPYLWTQAAKTRSTARRVKVGRLEPGDLWGMQHARGAMEAGVEIVAVEGCEVQKINVLPERFDMNGRARGGGGAPRSMKRSLRERRVADVINFSHVLWMKNSGLEITNKIEALGAARRMIPWCLTRLQPNPIPHAPVEKRHAF